MVLSERHCVCIWGLVQLYIQPDYMPAIFIGEFILFIAQAYSLQLVFGGGG